jgi:iron complex transport system ATP-binding protein
VTGSVRYDGADILRLSPAERARIVGYMPQALPQRVSLTIFEAMLSALHATPLNGDDRNRARERAYATLQGLGIGELAGRGLDELSGGQRQLASLGQALVREPAVLLLDEPTSALDLAHQYRVMSHVRAVAAARGIFAVVVLHDLTLACRWCDRIVVLSDGDVAADGRPEEAVTAEMLGSVYRVSGRVERCSKGFLQIIVDEALTAD